MGLDLIVEGRARSGHEAEWRQILTQVFSGQLPDEAQSARFKEISTPPYECLDAPRVGQSEAANVWIAEAEGAKTPEDVATVLKAFDGYYVVALVESDGVPKYSHGGLYEGVDETSFRGSFLADCKDVLSKAQIESAWVSKLPEEAVSYGRDLLAAADNAAAQGPPPPAPPRRGLLAGLGLGKKKDEAVAFEDQLDAVCTAGRWFVFWGERGHAIRAWS